MAHTHTCLLYHIVFSTKKREPWLHAGIRPDVFAYLAGTINNMEGQAILINGVADHVHILCELRSSHAVADVVRDVKTASSSWFHETYRRSAFKWQEGYGAFTVSPSQKKRVWNYIASQEEHHRTARFEDEYLGFLKRAGVKYDERFVLD